MTTKTTEKHYVGCPVTMGLSPCNCRTKTKKHKRPTNPLQRVLNMAKWYYSDNKFKHSIPARIEMREAMRHVKNMVKA